MGNDEATAVALLRQQHGQMNTTLTTLQDHSRSTQLALAAQAQQLQAMRESLERIEGGMKDLNAAVTTNSMTLTRHESELQTLNSVTRWGGGILATVVGAVASKVLGII